MTGISSLEAPGSPAARPWGGMTTRITIPEGIGGGSRPRGRSWTRRDLIATDPTALVALQGQGLELPDEIAGVD